MSLTNSCEDPASHTKSDGNSCLPHPSRAWVDQHTFSMPQTSSHHQRVIRRGIHHRYRGSLLQRPAHNIGHPFWSRHDQIFTSQVQVIHGSHQLLGTSQRKRLSASTQVARPLAGSKPITRFPLGSRPENSIPSMHCCRAMSPAFTKQKGIKTFLFLHKLDSQIGMDTNQGWRLGEVCRWPAWCLWSWGRSSKRGTAARRGWKERNDAEVKRSSAMMRDHRGSGHSHTPAQPTPHSDLHINAQDREFKTRKVTFTLVSDSDCTPVAHSLMR